MSSQRYHPAICVLHWLVASMIVAALLMSTFVMSQIPDTAPAKLPALMRHMSVGALVLLCSLLRWRLGRKKARPEPLSSGMPWADRLAFLVHRSLDALVLVLVGSGLCMAILGGVPSAVLAGQSQLLAELDLLPLHAVHVYAARLLFALLLLHAGGALYHQFILRDGLLSRMWFRRI